MATTLLRRRTEMSRKPLPECHEGKGTLDWTTVLAGADLDGRKLNFIHDDILAPGVSIGVHGHTHDEEYYLILAGHGRMTLDGAQHPVGPGDIAVVFPGGRHGLENDGDEDLRVIVWSVKTG